MFLLYSSTSELAVSKMLQIFGQTDKQKTIMINGRTRIQGLRNSVDVVVEKTNYYTILYEANYY